MKVAFITPSVSRSAGGIFEVEIALAKSLQESGCDVEVYSQTDENTEKDLVKWNSIKVNVFPSIGPHAFRYSPLLNRAVLSSNCDIAHLHVMWMYTSVVTNNWHKTGKPYITTIHGMLEPWALRNAKFKKKVVELLYERKCLENATCIHAHTLKEYSDIRSFGLKNPVCIIPNGVDIPIFNNFLEKPQWFKQTNNRKVLLYLGRLHPKKGLEALLSAWKNTVTEHHDWCLVIAGWGDKSYTEFLRKKIIEDKQEANIFLPGPQFDQEKNRSFANASGFILPSLSEGLPMAILEAWSYKLPVLSTPACNIPEGYERNAALKILPDQNGIEKGLKKLFSLSSDTRSTMGENGYRLTIEKFTWQKIGEQMAEVYKWVTFGGEKPHNVVMD
jgi:poly(glycerol-phosphate) alpha-glucosyltransferase